MAKSPLAPIDGISPQRVILRGSVPAGPTYYAGRAGDSPFEFGQVLPAGTVLEHPTPAWFHPDVPPEQPIPFTECIVYRGHGLIIVDKPPFVPSTPNGRIMRETIQTRLRVSERNNDIVAGHRLDRLTSGLLALSSDPASRAFYQQQFADRTARKRYVAQVTADLPLGTEWQTFQVPMLKIKGERQVRVDKRGKATVTRARMIGERLVELEPRTGHTHQLRVLCAYLGAPIVGDDTYPMDKGLELDNYSSELYLCATRLELRLWGSGGVGVWTSPRSSEAGFWGSPG